MLLSRRMEVARQLLSPLGPGARARRAILFFGGGPGRVASLDRRRGDRPRRRARRGVARVAGRRARARAARGARRLVRGLDRVVDRARPQLGVREPRRSSTSRSRSSARTSPVGRASSRSGFAVLLGAVCVWALAAKALPWLYRTTGGSRGCARPSATGTRSRCSATSRCRSGSGSPTPAARRRDAARLRLDRRDRADVLARRRRRRAWSSSSRGSSLSGAWVDALATLVAAGVPAAGVLALAFALHGVTSDGAVACDARARRRVFGAPCSPARPWPPRLAALPPPAPTRGTVAAGGARARGRGRDRRSPSAARTRARGGTVHEPGDGRALELARAGSSRRARTTAGCGGRRRGVASRTIPLAGTGAGLVRLHEPPLPHDEPRRGDRAAQPAGAVPVARRASSGSLLFAVGRAGARRARSAAERRRSSRSRSRCPRTSLHGLVDIDWDFAAVSGARLPRGRRARRARRPSGPARLARRGARRRRASRSRSLFVALRRLARRPLVRTRPARARPTPRTRDHAREARALDRPARGRAALHAGAGRAGALGNPGEGARPAHPKATERPAGERREPGTRSASSTSELGCPRHALPELEPLQRAEPAGPRRSRRRTAR